MELTVVERNGWEKPTKFDKAVVRIGSAPVNDIPLASPGIAPIHLQVIHNPDNPGSCKVLNLGPSVSMLAGSKESNLEQGQQVEVRDGDEVILGEYHILFNLPLSSSIMQSSRKIAASLAIDEAVLRADLPTTGFLKLQNLGDEPNCQFQVVVNGLPEGCSRLDPPPILYPGGTEDVRIQFFHRCAIPPAGYVNITISVTAPAAYPGEEVVIRQELYISPLLRSAIHIGDDMPVEKTESPKITPLPEEIPTEPEPALEALEAVPPEGNDAEPVAAVESPTPPKEPPAPKVVRNPSETYWDENS